jgi:hypothetical protein
MKTATIIKITDSQTIVNCPYCNKAHSHGNAGSKSAAGETRMAHCPNGGEYIMRVNNAHMNDDDMCIYCNWGSHLPESHILHSSDSLYGNECAYIKSYYRIYYEDGEMKFCGK